METNQDNRVLGVWLSPDGNNSDDLKILVAKVAALGRNIAISKLSRSEVATAYEFILRPSMKYQLCSTTFNIQECATIDRSYLPYVLSEMGFNKNTKRLLLIGPQSLGGFGFTDTFTDQGISQLTLFIGHIRLNQEICTLLHILMENMQLVVGFGLPLFGHPFARITKFCDHTWKSCMWEFVDSIGAQLHIEKRWDLLPQRTNDIFLMEVLSSPNFRYPPKTLKRLNA